MFPIGAFITPPGRPRLFREREDVNLEVIFMLRVFIYFLIIFIGSAGFCNVHAESGLSDYQAAGYVELFFYPPHNEFDPNPGLDFKDRPVSRYGLEIYFELRPKALESFFVFAEPRFYFGDSRPQIDYNYQAEPIVVNLRYGLGYDISSDPDIEIRLTHGKWIDLGNYKGEGLQWNGISLRWSFGR